jgi:hypothetical protein
MYYLYITLHVVLVCPMCFSGKFMYVYVCYNYIFVYGNVMYFVLYCVLRIFLFSCFKEFTICSHFFAAVFKGDQFFVMLESVCVFWLGEVFRLGLYYIRYSIVCF